MGDRRKEKFRAKGDSGEGREGSPKKATAFLESGQGVQKGNVGGKAIPRKFR